MATSDGHVDCSRATWRKSTYSSANGECVEVAAIGLTIAVRNSKQPDGPALLVTRSDWTAFIRGVEPVHLGDLMDYDSVRHHF